MYDRMASLLNFVEIFTIKTVESILSGWADSRVPSLSRPVNESDHIEYQIHAGQSEFNLIY